MDIRELIKIINQNEEAKQFWKKFLNKDIRDELLKYPELLSMQDVKRAKIAKEEKEFFLKCIFSVSTENGIKFEKEERVFDSFYEKLGQYIKIVLKQKLIASLTENMIDSLVKQIVQRVFWIPFRCLMVSAKYSCGFSNTLISSIIVGERYLDYFTTITEDRLWQLLAKPVFRWRNSSGLSMNAAKAV